jgi:hypothetical protein
MGAGTFEHGDTIIAYLLITALAFVKCGRVQPIHRQRRRIESSQLARGPT